MDSDVDDFYDRAFSRNRGLINEHEQQKIKNTRVAIAGMGGMGGMHAATLARTGIGKFTIADFDCFEIHNINRQYGATVSTIGQDKAQVMAAIIKDINPSAEVTVINAAIGPDNMDQFLSDADVVIDGLDIFVLPARRLMLKQAKIQGLPVFAAAPIGFSTMLSLYSPDGMDFDSFFDIDDSMSEKEMIVAMFACIPWGPQFKYTDVDMLDSQTGGTPVVTTATQLGAGMIAAEVVKYVLGIPGMKAMPRFMQFDPYVRQFKHHHNWFGGKNPLFKLKKRLVKKLMPHLV